MEDEVTINITKKVEDCGDDRLIEDCCIYKVPNKLRCVKGGAYTPDVVSIGPFHHGKERLQDMEKHKQILFKRFIQKAMSSLNDLVCLVRSFEPKVRASYSETIELTEQKLVELTLMDAGFIIEFFFMLLETDVKTKKDAKLSPPWLVGSILRDLILLENQLPFFIIKEIFNKAFPSCIFLTFMCEGFERIIPHNFELNPDIEIEHFTDLLRLLYLKGRTPPRKPLSADASKSLSYNANALQEAGIKLKISPDNTCLLDLKFSGHNLEIPQILVDERTESIFRNMIALEQCHYPYACYITDYATVLDTLIDSNKDVDLLVQKDIVKAWSGDSNDVAKLFNGLQVNVITQPNFKSEYLDIWERLNKYCQDPWNKKMTTLRRDYCKTPWRTAASIAGILLLVLTIVETIFSVLQVVLNK